MTNARSDIEESISTYNKLLPLLAEDHPLRSHSLHMLGLNHVLKFSLTEDFLDLECSIKLFEEALAIAELDDELRVELAVDSAEAHNAIWHD